jgi:hypothetical protein
MISPEPPPYIPPKLGEDIINAICAELDKKPSQIYVLWNPVYHSVAFDPMTKKPVNSTNRKIAEHYAKSTGCKVITLTEALKLRIKFEQGK